MKKTTLSFLTFIFTCVVHAQNLKVITYNIRFNNPADNENRWDNRKEFLKNQLAFYEPDVFGLQEALPDQIDYLAEHLSAYDHVGKGRDEGGVGEGSPVFFKKDRFRLEKKHTFWLSDTPEKVSKGWDAALPRICTYVLLLDKTSGKRFWVFNTHLDHIGETARTRGIELILKQIEKENQRNYPVVFIGDFNSTPDKQRIQSLSQKMDDTALISVLQAFGPQGTFNGFQHSKTVTDRIDYIFISKYESFVVKKFAILSDSDQGRYPSDHLPVYAELEFKKNKKFFFYFYGTEVNSHNHKPIYLAKLKKISLGTFFFLLFAAHQLYAQEIPNILYYTPEDYRGETQNWMIDQDAKGHIYVANNSGLLDYNGVSWDLYATPNQTIMRSVKVVNDRIYTGFYMGFGYWTRNDKGILDYFNLSDKIKNQLIEDEQIWNIHALSNKVLFQSLNQIFIYDPENEAITVKKIDGIIEKSISLNGILYFHTIEGKIYKLENGVPLWVADIPLKGDDRIENILNTPSGISALTKRNGFFKIKNHIATKWSVPADDFLKINSVYKSLQLSDGRLALGLVANGLLILNEKGEIDEQFSTSNGLTNNTILSLFEDRKQNIWLGLDIGINLINLETRLKKFFDPYGKLGTTYAAAVFEGNLYLGTNQGLYFKKLESDDNFELIPNTKDQVWNLFVFDNTLFCAHNFGIYVVKQNVASLIFSDYGVWTFEPNPLKENELIVGTFKGLGKLRKGADGNWAFKKIQGFDISSRNIATDSLHNIWVSHEYKGVYHLKTDENYETAALLPNNFQYRNSKNASVTNFKNNILFADSSGVFQYNYNSKLFEKNTFYSRLIDTSAYQSGKLINIENKELWVFNREDIRYFTTNSLTGELVLKSIHLSQSLRKSMQGYENITYLPNQTYLLGNTEGYLLFPKEQETESDFSFEIVSVNLVTKTGNSIHQKIEGTFEAEYGYQSINYVLSDYSHNSINPTEFSYRLYGANDEWSPWQASPILSFGFLEWGSYRLEIRARKGDEISSKVISYPFSVKRPWYFSNLSILTYVCIAVLLIFIIHRRYRLYYRKKQNLLLEEKQKQMDEISLINKQQIIQLKNEQLNLLVEKKNRELENVTANLIKKNELLNNLSKEIKKLPNQQNLKPLLNFIEKNRNENKDWQIFEEAFNNADKEFINKLKNKHPNLTNNDLKLCAYLRLNLSSKEIAPLLNISVRSLEIKRYRLRQKLDLPHENNLTDYILSQ